MKPKLRKTKAVPIAKRAPSPPTLAQWIGLRAGDDRLAHLVDVQLAARVEVYGSTARPPDIQDARIEQAYQNECFERAVRAFAAERRVLMQQLAARADLAEEKRAEIARFPLEALRLAVHERDVNRLEAERWMAQVERNAAAIVALEYQDMHRVGGDALARSRERDDEGALVGLRRVK